VKPTQREPHSPTGPVPEVPGLPPCRPDDIAVVGAGCRFPGGVRSLDDLWRVLIDGTDVVRPVPADRWDTGRYTPDPATRGAAGAAGLAEGGFLDDIDRFDAEFFGVSPREARQLDPQQRLLLEVAWEAMQDAGVPREDWHGTRTSVHVGILASDYLVLHAKTTGTAAIDPYYATGKEFSFAAGRIAYTFGLRGPCMAVNTACSSSLVSVHLACQALRSGEVDTALAGGVNAIVSPELTVFMGKVRALSPTGRCKPFDARADGIVRGEGCGIVVLKRYADALRDADRVLAVIRGSAVNHDGHSAGLTVPNTLAQEDLLREALRSAGFGPGAPAYVEAHGTGTPLGDPMEVAALGAVLGRDRPSGRPLLLGSLKGNFGHMDSAAGIAGLLKALLVARHRVVPPTLHHSEPSPLIDWAAANVAVPVGATALTDRPGPVAVGVSAFGLSGTNAHILLSSPPPGGPEPADRADGAVHTLLVSATSRDGLGLAAADHAELIGRTDTGLDRLLAAAAVRRDHGTHRLAVVGTSAAQLVGALRDFGAGTTNPAVAYDRTGADAAPPVVHVFSGQGSQWPGMGLDLYRSEPLVRDVLDECQELIRDRAGWSLLDALGDRDEARLKATQVAQPALFALQVALSRLWSSWGVRPDLVIGHSMGEVAAACVAGALTLSDAISLIVRRGALMQRASGGGRMAAVPWSADETRRALAEHPQVCVATVNGPRSVVIAGAPEPMDRAVRHLAGLGARAVPLPVDHAFHSPLVADCADALEKALEGLSPAEPGIAFMSSVDPEQDAPALDAAYWGRNLREPVLLWPAVDRLLARGDAAFVEIGAHPVLAGPLRAALTHRARTGPVVASLVRGLSGPLALARSRARAHTAGVRVDWSALHPAPVAGAALPPPRWAGDRYWLPGVERGVQGPLVPATPASGASSATPVAGLPVAGGPALGEGGVPAAGDRMARDQVAEVIQRCLAEVLGHPQDRRLPPTRGFHELGLDSVATVEFAQQVANGVDRPVDAADVLTHPTVSELTAFVLTRSPARAAVDPAPEASAPAASADDTRTRAAAGPVPSRRPVGARTAPAAQGAPRLDGPPAPEPIAVIGLACRLPGGVEDPEGLWRLLAEKTDATSEVPAGRWAARAGTPGRGAFLDRVDGFDHGFFRVTPREARSMDPQQRIFLEVAWEALEDAGLPAGAVRGSRTGVFVGLNTSDYKELVTRRPEDIDLYYGTGNSFSATAGRLSYFLGARGPSLALDTACSSSLTAVHLACQSLRTGESEVAIAGGANVMATPTVQLAMSAAGALAPDGRCKTFDDSADGYGRGEGAAAVVLKRLSSARRDGDRVYAVIRGSAVNQDGASAGLTVPSGRAQEDVIRDALDQAGVEAGQVSYVEAHGTGTRLGDAIELRALAGALAAGRTAEDPLLVGSLKTNIGHLEAASGVTGLIKTVLALVHQEIPAQLHTATPTRQVDWQGLKLRAVTEPVAWPRGTAPRTAGVSAFGFTGTNAHVVLQEAEPEEAPPAHDHRTVYVLTASAAGPAALRAVAARLRGRVLAARESELADLCWTAAARRSRLPYRLAVTGSGSRELVELLDRAEKELTARPELLGSPAELAETWTGAVGGLYFGLVPAGQDDGGDGGGEDEGGGEYGAGPAQAARAYVEGRPVDWAALFPGPRRIVALPRYPWQRTRHWIESPPADREQEQEPDPSVLPVSPSEPALTAELLALPPEPREQRLLDALLTLAAEVMGGGAGDIGPDQGFFDLGLDSVLSQDLKARTEKLLGCELPGTVMFECPTTRSLARFVLDEVLTGPAPGPGQDPVAAVPAIPAAAVPTAAVPTEAVASDADLADDELLARLLDAVAGSQALLTEGE
jgi:acyl transferase domain-containing protein